MPKESIQKQEQLTYISSFISKTIKTKFGKGPETCYTTISDQYAIIHIRKFMTQIEEELVGKGKIETVKVIRTTLMEDLFDQFQEMLQELLGKVISEMYHDWNYLTNSGAILFVWNAESIEENIDNNLTYELLKNEIIKRSEYSLYQPRYLEIKNIGPDIFLAQAEGFMLPIEKSIYVKGHINLLKEREEEIRANYQQSTARFERILLKNIEDIFMIWNYEENKSYTILYCKS